MYLLCREYSYQLKQLHLPLTHIVEVLGEDLKFCAPNFSPASKLKVEGRWQEYLYTTQGSTAVNIGLWGANAIIYILNTFSNAVMNHIKENKIAVQTNPLFSWVSEQLHCIWGTVDFSWLNQRLWAKGVSVDLISQVIHAQMNSSYCYAHPFLPPIFLQLFSFLRQRITKIHRIQTRVSMISMQKQPSLMSTDSMTT